MRRGYFGVVVIAALLPGLTGQSAAQIVVPNVNTGGKSTVPSVSSDPQNGSRLDTRGGPTFSSTTITPRTTDPRCGKLTPGQRQLTPGCQ